jgi:FO synthase subunit 2
MFGHVETSLHKARHLETIRELQKERRGFTEFVPLSFVHHEAPMFNFGLVQNMRPGPDGNEIVKMHAISRIMLDGFIDNIQVSWVKEGPRMSQLLLDCGVNDFGGTLMNESISTAAGAQHGQLMKPKQIQTIIRSAGRVPAQRSTLYGLINPQTQVNDPDMYALDNVDPTNFGSYHELINLDKFRYHSTRK